MSLPPCALPGLAHLVEGHDEGGAGGDGIAVPCGKVLRHVLVVFPHARRLLHTSTRARMHASPWAALWPLCLATHPNTQLTKWLQASTRFHPCIPKRNSKQAGKSCSQGLKSKQGTHWPPLLSTISSRH